MRPLSIRWRLTLWYSGVLTALLAAFSAAVFIMMRHHLIERTDEILSGELEEVRDALGGEGSRAYKQSVLRQRFAADERFEFEIVDSAGGLFFSSSGLAGRSLATAVPADNRERQFADGVLAERGVLRVVYEKVPSDFGPLELRVATSMELDRKELQHLLWVIFLAGPLALLGAVGGGYVLARRAFEPVDRMVATSAGLTARQLNRRLAVVNPEDELGRLAKTLNQMIERLEQSFVEMQRFTADAAHELRTPLAIMRNQAEVALRSGRTVDEYRHVLESLLDENDRLTRLADQLLYLSREDAGLLSFSRRPVRLDELLQGVIEHMQVLASEQNVAIEFDSTSATVDGDDDRLRRVFYNLIDNAIKYTAVRYAAAGDDGGGIVRVACRMAGSNVRVTIADNGTGIAAEHLPHIFARFYRVDASRGDAVRGTGLGLAICRSIVESHGGRILIESQVDRGTTVTVVLPTKMGDHDESEGNSTHPRERAMEELASVSRQ